MADLLTRPLSKKPILYPWDDLPVGQSFAFPLNSLKSAQSSANQWRRSRGVVARFVWIVDGDEVTVTRVADYA